MNKIFVNISILLFLIFSSQASGQIINLIGYDKEGNKLDEISFGKDENASVGIDEELGETDYSNFSGQTGIYILQKDSINHNCINDFYTSEAIYFEEEFEAKKNFRPFNNKDELFFEIKIVNPDSFGIFQLFMDNGTTILNEFIDYNALHYGLCDSDTSPFLLCEFEVELNELEFLSRDLNSETDYLNFIILKFKNDFLVSNKEVDLQIPNKIFPNPTEGFINFEQINVNNNALISIEIYNNLGFLCHRNTYSNSSIKQIDISFLPSGIYTLILNYEGKEFQIEKIIKI